VKRFAGFPPGDVRCTPVADLFFSELLPQIDSMPELKVSLHVLWLLHRQRGQERCVSKEELQRDGVLLRGLKEPGDSPQRLLEEGLERAVARGTLLQLDTRAEDGEEQSWYFLNSEGGRAAMDQVRRGELVLSPATVLEDPLVEVERPNIFVLYEQNVGTLQPMIAEELQEAEESYPAAWIEEAFRIAAEQNVRKWRYIRAILERWSAEGKDDGEGRAGSEEDRYRYIKGRYKDYVKH
jgi:DNA replication protein